MARSLLAELARCPAKSAPEDSAATGAPRRPRPRRESRRRANELGVAERERDASAAGRVEGVALRGCSGIDDDIEALAGRPRCDRVDQQRFDRLEDADRPGARRELLVARARRHVATERPASTAGCSWRRSSAIRASVSCRRCATGCATPPRAALPAAWSARPSVACPEPRRRAFSAAASQCQRRPRAAPKRSAG